MDRLAPLPTNWQIDDRQTTEQDCKSTKMKDFDCREDDRMTVGWQMNSPIAVASHHFEKEDTHFEALLL